MMEENLNNLEHAFWDLVALLADHLPEDDPYEDDPETLAYIHECRERFESDKQEFDLAVKVIRKQVQDGKGRKQAF